jgi:hypothetical protein
LIEVPTTNIGESIMNSIKTRDFAAFKEATPTTIHSEFYNFNKDLMESLNENINHENVIKDEPENLSLEPIIQIED